jgi:hypothetical protein
MTKMMNLHMERMRSQCLIKFPPIINLKNKRR